jgi:hypothetical protein
LKIKLKKKRRYYIHCPSKLRLPVTEMAVGWLLFDRMHAPEWCFIGYWIVVSIIISLQIYYWCKIDAREVDIEDFLKEHYNKTCQDEDTRFEKLKEYLNRTS